jgi:putative beta-lysine N-acetyltransferase
MRPDAATQRPHAPDNATAADSVVTLGSSLVQHGPGSGRVYLMKLAEPDLPGILDEMEALALWRGYTKIFAKVPAGAARAFTARGYEVEATVPGFYNGAEAGVFLGRYFDEARRRPADPEALQAVLREALEKGQARATRAGPLPDHLELVELGPEAAGDMARLYAATFRAYPFPIHDPGYIRETMAAHVRYFGVVEGGRLAALSSAEVDKAAANAELTDFATRPEHRGAGLAGVLLAHMERVLAAAGVVTGYSIARAETPGVNIVFARAGYAHAGALPNNTRIGEGLETMNVWYKALNDAG